jgi:hypothetical protein
MAAIVVLVILALIMSAIAWQIVASGRILQHRVYELQAESLVRSGIEVAAARLLERPEGYHGESMELIERSTVTIEVSGVPSLQNAYRVTCAARYPTDLVAVVVREQSRTFHRVVDGESVRLECVVGSDGEQ